MATCVFGVKKTKEVQAVIGSLRKHNQNHVVWFMPDHRGGCIQVGVLAPEPKFADDFDVKLTTTCNKRTGWSQLNKQCGLDCVALKLKDDWIDLIMSGAVKKMTFGCRKKVGTTNTYSHTLRVTKHSVPDPFPDDV